MNLKRGFTGTRDGMNRRAHSIIVCFYMVYFFPEELISTCLDLLCAILHKKAKNALYFLLYLWCHAFGRPRNLVIVRQDNSHAAVTNK